jgi:hypothetical protein
LTAFSGSLFQNRPEFETGSKNLLKLQFSKVFAHRRNRLTVIVYYDETGVFSGEAPETRPGSRNLINILNLSGSPPDCRGL